MVDRITPRPTAELNAQVLAATGWNDAAPVMSAAFIQGVIEDDFCNGRPDGERVGAEMVADVAPYWQIIELATVDAGTGEPRAEAIMTVPIAMIDDALTILRTSQCAQGELSVPRQEPPLQAQSILPASVNGFLISQQTATRRYQPAYREAIETKMDKSSTRAVTFLHGISSLGVKAMLVMKCTYSMLSLALGFFLVSPTAAQQSYPVKPITIIVPFAAGGPTDVVARIVGEHMARTLGQSILIENVSGAGGSTGMTRVAQSAPDGYTIGVGNMGTQSAAPALYPNLKYDPAKSFEQIGIVNYTPQVVVSKTAIAAKTLAEFLAHLKANGEKLSYGHAGVGSISHVAGVVFNSQFGAKPGLVAYRGTGPAMNDLVGGQIDYMVDQALNVIPQIKAGTIKAYAVAASERLESLPDVPTTKEAGVDFIFSAWNAMVGPKGLPDAIRERLVEALNAALDDETVRKRYVELGSTGPKGADRGPAGLQKLVESEVARITPVLKAAGASAN